MSRIKELLGGKHTKDSGGLIYRWELGCICVNFLNGRRQLIEYRLDGDYYIFISKVVRPAIVERVGRERIAREILLRNRVIDVVAFRFSNNGSVEGRIEQRAATLQAEELRFYLGLLAREADRFEYLLTGRDTH